MAEHPTAKVDSLLLTESADDFYSSPRDRLKFDPDGIVDDARHRGRFMVADVRIPSYNRGQDKVLNRQQVSFIDDQSLEYIGDKLRLESEVIENEYGHERTLFLARCIGANIIFSEFEGTEGIPEFHNLPNSTDFGPYGPERHKFNNASVMIVRYNKPCINPGRKIEEYYPDPPEGVAQEFVRVAKSRRGFVGMVVKTGEMAVGDSVIFAPMPTAEE